MTHSQSALRLVVGLGNPGAEYAETRHNAGVWLLERLLVQQQTALRIEHKFSSLYARSADVHWLFPQTFMNASGRAVAAICKFYKIEPSQLIVLHDELDLPAGSARYKQGGGHGGHNGLKDIIAALNTPQFWRLRIGIGHPGDRQQVVNWVLKPPRVEEQKLIDGALEQVLDSFPYALTGDMAAAMRTLHTQAVR